MNKMSVRVDTYRDGGTVLIRKDDVEYCIDHRIDTKTRGFLYKGYPKEGGLVTEPKDLFEFMTLVTECEMNPTKNEIDELERVVDKIIEQMNEIVAGYIT